ncbi:uncharacterized protein LOC123303074 [Chrysoperla carnea]|uniref:uncharacterized protein LOC123303074 n=1 Tax=Chrysoperla carnea TaxID=189513 RepID=UPI001D079159|nr:uncharacterized protein LOC123303074 [Chrysoperla carnea]
MMAHASAMTYTPSVSSGGKNATDTETDSSTHQSCENELLALDISGSGENGTTNRSASNNKRSYYDRAYLSFPGDSESPKKRRKQSTPVKIPTTNPENESEQAQGNANNTTSTTTASQEGKLETHNSSSSPALANSTTPSPDVFKATGEEGPSTSPTTSNPPLAQNMHSDLFKIDFGAPSWLPDIQSKTSEDWLGTPPPLHSVPFSFPSSSLQSPVLPGQVVTQFPSIMDANQQSGSGHGLLTRPMSQGPRIRIFNPDAYCELCNKEFCNKYFLKTHKANKHGIYTDLQPNDLQYQTSGPTANNHTNTIKPLTLPQSIPELPAKIGSESTSSPKIASNLLTASCDICQKKFCNKNLVKRHKVKVHGITDDTQSNDDNSNLDPNISDSNSETPVQIQSPNSSNNYYQEGLPECLKPFLDTDFDSDNLQQYRWQQSNVSQQVREAIHRPRGLGIINPEAFCEICCKEYCNKYFLRTHKLKRHGIAIPDDPPTPRDANSVPPTSTSDNTRTVQTSPLNLIKSEQTTSSSESYSDKKDSEIMMCGICGVHVAQKYMKAHYEACHIAKNPSDNNPTASTATSSPMSTSGRQLDLNDELNTSETASNDKPPTEENINEDLKKLQTMILQLNNLNVCQIVSCNVCCKEFENKFYLQAHMMSDHGQLYMKITDEKISIQNTTNIITTPTQNSNEGIPTPVPTASIKVVPSESLTSSKMFPSNSDIPATERLTPSDNYNPQTSSRNTTPTIQAPVERRSSISLAPTNSYCEICNKELCNKYFMKTHMQRMHGIEIENGAQIGGVVCNICNKELCSKYFLRVHKHNTHGIVEEASAPPIEAPTQFQVQPIPPPSDASLKPNELGDLNHRYFAHFTEVCPICSRRFRSTKWLKAHLVTDHGKSEHDKWEELELLYQKQAAKMNDPTNFKLHDEIKVPNGAGSGIGILEHDTDKVGIQNLISNIFGQDELHSKKYYCSFCNFSTPVLAFLFVHERSHGQPSHTNIYQCPICTQSYQTGEQLQQHLIVQHSNITSQKLFKTTVSSSSNVTPTPPDNCSNTSMPANNNNAETDTKPDDNNTDTNTNGNDIKPKIYDLRRIFHTDNLVEMAQQMQIPTTYALPQGHGLEMKNSDDEDIVDKKYMMQPFLIEEYHEKTTMGIQLRLVPSLVFLPVRERVTSPLTTSIKFTPT